MENERQEKNEVFSGQKARELINNSRNPTEDLGFEIPLESVPLPSKGIIDPEENPLHMAETIDIRAMRGKDMDILNSPALAKKGTTITEVLKACLVDKRIDVKNMISGDRDAIMVALRILSFGSEYPVEISCPKCGENQEIEFNLNNVPINSLKVEPDALGENKFSLTLPFSKKKVVVKFLTGTEEEDIMVASQKKKKNKVLNEGLITTQMLFSITSVDGKSDRAFVNKFVNNMPARDVLYVQRFLAKNTPSAELKGEFDCNICDENSEVDIPIGASFFWPNK